MPNTNEVWPPCHTMQACPQCQRETAHVLCSLARSVQSQRWFAYRQCQVCGVVNYMALTPEEP